MSVDVFHAVVSIYAVPEPVHRRFYAKDWNLHSPLFHCAVWLDPDEGPADLLRVRLETVDGTLIAIAPYNGARGISPVADSARHYVVVVTNGEVDAELGIGFADPSDSIDFSLAIQRFMQRRLTVDRLESSRWRERLTSRMEDRAKQNPGSPRKNDRPSSPSNVPDKNSDPSESSVSDPHLALLSPPPPPLNGFTPKPDTPPDHDNSPSGSDSEFGDFQ